MSSLLENANPKWDYSAEVILAGGEQARKNWEGLLAHTDAEWSGDIERTMESMSPDPYQTFHFTGQTLSGYDAVRAYYEDRFKNWPPGQGFYAKRWVVTDQYAVGEGVTKITPTGTFFGYPASGKAIVFPVAIWIFFENGKVKGEVSYADSREIERQARER
jgi:predicted ester cyclase